MMQNKKVIIATGGTGGHIFPAKALAKILSKNKNKVTIFANKNYKKYHQKSDLFQFNIIPASQIPQNKFLFIKAGFLIALGILKSFILMLFKKPDIIIAFGGYSTFPTLIAAIILRKKIILHEQNAHLGKVNRIFAKYSNIIALSFQKTDGILTEFKKKTKYVGNPVRDEIKKLSKEEYKYPEFDKRYQSKNNLGYNLLLASDFQEIKKIENEYFNILIIGGSGGAEIFSKILPRAFFNVRTNLQNNINIVQQCRGDLIGNTFKEYKKFNLNVSLKVFFQDIDKQIKDAHLVIARSGSSTISELTMAKKPMILVPFAKSADNHQEKNANEIAKSGGAIIMKEKDFTINKISNLIEKLIDNPNLLKKMSRDSFKLANKNATSKLAKLIEQQI